MEYIDGIKGLTTIAGPLLHTVSAAMQKPNSLFRRLGPILFVIAATWAQASLAAPEVAPSAGVAAVLKRLQGSTWVAEGSKRPAHVLYAVVDPNCPFCHDLWLSARSLDTRDVQIRYIVVGILASNSPGKAAAILEARDPAKAWDWNESHWAQLPDDMGGGIKPLDHPKPITLAAIARNEDLIRSLGIQGTPAVIYLDHHGRLHLVESAPDPVSLGRMAESAAP